MGDWTAGLGILIVAVLWIQIFIDYRRKLVRMHAQCVDGIESTPGDQHADLRFGRLYTIDSRTNGGGKEGDR